MRLTFARWLLPVFLVILPAACVNPAMDPLSTEPTATQAPLATLDAGGAEQPGVQPGQPSNGLPTATEPPDQPVSSDTPFQPQPPAWLPQPEDKALKRGEVIIEEFNLLVLESFPPQYRLAIQGMLPTPCHKLRILVHPPDEQKRIRVEAYSLINPDPNLMCIQVIEPFQANIALEVQASGHYTVWLNDQQIGEFDHP